VYTTAHKTFRDPVHGNMVVHHQFLLELIDTPVFQRLRHIRQLGLCSTVFPGAEHSRFQHVLGASHLAQLVCRQWHERRLLSLTTEQEQAVIAAALLHDLGHGPYSHALEHVFSGLSHETLGENLIHEFLAPIFQRHHVSIDLCCSLINAKTPDPQQNPHFRLLKELISGPVDVDRMDYLQRDSLYTGVKYGLFDSERLTHCLVPHQTDLGWQLALEQKGVEAVEEFLFSRYFMYWQVYFHPTVRACEYLLRAALTRAHWLWANRRELELPKPLEFLFEASTQSGQLNLEFADDSQQRQRNFLTAFANLEDGDLQSALKIWMHSSDIVLRDLSQRLRQRRFLKVLPHPIQDAPDLDIAAQKMARIRDIVANARGRENLNYYLGEDLHNAPKNPTTSRPRVLTRTGQLADLAQVTRTNAIQALEHPKTVGYLFLPEECRQPALTILNA
jgi:uncharacterized protein